MNVILSRAHTLAFLLLIFTLAGCGGGTQNTNTTPVSTAPGVPASSTSSGFSPAFRGQLDLTVASLRAQLNVPGVVVHLTVPGVGDYVNTTGVADRTTQAPIQVNQHIRIGSVTKTFTVTLILQLMDQGLLSVDDPISKYFPGYPRPTATLRELANMSSGLASYTFDTNFQNEYFTNPTGLWTPQQLIAIGARDTNAGCTFAPDACFEPGQGFFYCNTNTVLLGLVVEQVTGQPFGSVLQSKILGPLGLTGTSEPTDSTIAAPVAHGYTSQGQSGANPVDATYWNPSWAFAVGDMISTVEDLRVWARALGRGTLLKPATQALRLQPNPNPPNSSTRYYGLGIGFDRGWLGHSGELPGYNTVVFYQPDLDATMVVAVNADGVPFQGKSVDPASYIASTLVDLVAQEIPLPPLDDLFPVDDPDEPLQQP